MNECNSIEVTNTYSNLSDQTKFRLNEINKGKDYFNSEIQERKIWSQKLSKYIPVFDYFDNIISFTSAIGVPLGISSASFSLIKKSFK